jgi:uncharacterized membrane protein
LPPPAALADYEAAHPGAAQWIIDEATKNAEHVRTMERKAIALRRLDMLLRRLLPFIVVTLFLAAGVLIAIFANPWAGGAAVIATMAGVLTAYLKGRAQLANGPPASSTRP